MSDHNNQRQMRILLIVAVAFACAGCRPAARTEVFIDPALVSLVPNDTIALAGIRLDKLQKTDVYKKHLGDRPLPVVDAFVRETGIDPSLGLWEFLVASNGNAAVVLCRGKFSDMGLEPRTSRPGAKRFSHGGYIMLGDERTAVTFPNASTAIYGPTPLVRSVIDQRGKGQLGIPKGLAPLVKALPAQSQMWIAGSVSAQLAALNPRQHGNAGNFAQFARAIDTAWAGMEFGAGVKVRGVAVCHSEEDAQRLRSTVRAAAGMGRLSTPPERTDLMAAWDSIKAEVRDGRTVDVAADLTGTQIDSLLGLLRLTR